MLDEKSIRELVTEYGPRVNTGRPIRQLIDDGELPRLRGATVQEGKVSDSVFGEALRSRCGRPLRLMFRNNRISTHDVNRGAIPFKDQILPKTCGCSVSKTCCGCTWRFRARPRRSISIGLRQGSRA